MKTMEFTVSQAAQFLETSRQNVQNWIKSGELNARYLGAEVESRLNIKGTDTARKVLVIEESLYNMRLLKSKKA